MTMAVLLLLLLLLLLPMMVMTVQQDGKHVERELQQAVMDR